MMMKYNEISWSLCLWSSILFILRCNSITTGLALSSTAYGDTTIAQRTVRNWLSICQQLQSADLYDASWADACQLAAASDGPKNQQLLVTSQAVTHGEILSLFPVHAIELDGFDIHYSGAEGVSGTTTRHCLVPLSASIYYRDSGLTDTSNLCVKGFHNILNSGWRGHLASQYEQLSSTPPDAAQQNDPLAWNCAIVPLIGAAPICALVSTRAIDKEGTPLVLKSSSKQQQHQQQKQSKVEDELLAMEVLKKYVSEIAELRSYTTLAYEPIPYEAPSPLGHLVYHQISYNYPRMTTLHEKPDVLQVSNFLTPNECEELIAKARPHLRPCLVKNAETGAVEPDSTRTSTDANIPQCEIPEIVTKVCDLLNCSPSHLEIFQVLRYTESQKFCPHTDGFDGPITACGFENSGRLVTLFCYLNTLPSPSVGGVTRFTQLDLNIKPVQGTAVVHFPN